MAKIGIYPEIQAMLETVKRAFEGPKMKEPEPFKSVEDFSGLNGPLGAQHRVSDKPRYKENASKLLDFIMIELPKNVSEILGEHEQGDAWFCGSRR